MERVLGEDGLEEMASKLRLRKSEREGEEGRGPEVAQHSGVKGRARP